MTKESGKNNNQNVLKALAKEPILRFVQKIYEEHPKAEVYLVGGIIRDELLDKVTEKDFDLIVRNVSQKKLQATLRQLGKVNLVGKTFGVFKFMPKPYKKWQDKYPEVDIALPRTEESYAKTGAHKDFQVKFDPKLEIEKDLMRRDFTINAMALNLKTLELIDPYNGQKDLEKGVIRAVGKPEERFKEDFARFLRALRFACQLDFKIETKTRVALEKMIKNLNKKIDDEWVVPREVVAKEFLQALYYDPVRAMEVFDKSGAFKVLMPEVLAMKNTPQPDNWHQEGDVWNHTLLCLHNITSKKFRNKFPDLEVTAEFVYAVLWHDVGKPYTIETPEKDGTDRIRFSEHEIVGAEMARDKANELKLSAPVKYNLDPDEVFWLIKSHLVGLHDNMSEMKDTTMEKYFFSKVHNSQALLALMYIDTMSTIWETGKPGFGSFNRLMKRIEKLEKVGKGKRSKAGLPKELLNGYDIMKALKIKPGPKIKEVKEVVREKQLKGQIKNKGEAIKFIKKSTKNQGPSTK